MNYTEGQHKALDLLSKWYNKKYSQKDDYFFTLQGWSGTGKTTIIKEFLKTININKNSIAVTAPTHKAKKVIQNATGYNSETIQSLLGLRPDTSLDNFNANNPIFNTIAEDKFSYYRIVIIDESSMLNKQAYDFICNKAYERRVRVVFMGDKYQLPPVNESVSKVFTNVVNTAQLDEIVRQEEENPMYEFIHKLREDVMIGSDNGIKALLSKGTDIVNNQGFNTLDNKEFAKKAVEYYKNDSYSMNTDYIKYLAYTNKNVIRAGLGIRESLLGEESKNILNVGECLMSYNTILKNYNDLVITNSEEYIVKNISKLTEDSNGVKGYTVTIKNDHSIFSNSDIGKKVFIVDHRDCEKFKEHIKKLVVATFSNRSAWRHYFKFKNEYILIQDIYNNNGSLLCKKDMFYSQAITIHKSQGSTYNNVAINLKDIYRQPDIRERSRLIYVGLSRAKNINLILG